MRLHRWVSGRAGRGIVLALGLALSGASFALAHEGSAEAKLEATIFSYDGHDFVRTHTTLLTKEGKSAVNTKLEHDTPAYEALSHKHSYSGEATVLGRKYDANYAPLTSKDGQLTGALFVAVAK
jgi:methyl-accepting chemotaxis protein